MYIYMIIVIIIHTYFVVLLTIGSIIFFFISIQSATITWVDVIINFFTVHTLTCIYSLHSLNLFCWVINNRVHTFFLFQYSLQRLHFTVLFCCVINNRVHSFSMQSATIMWVDVIINFLTVHTLTCIYSLHSLDLFCCVINNRVHTFFLFQYSLQRLHFTVLFCCVMG